MSIGREEVSKWTACDWPGLHSCLSCRGEAHTHTHTHM